MRKNFFGAIEDFFGQAGKARDLNSVTLVGASWDNFAKKDDLLVPFAHSNVQIADAFAFVSQLG
jgi:hypothetical protein